jgi:hypothetical protein
MNNKFKCLSVNNKSFGGLIPEPEEGAKAHQMLNIDSRSIHIKNEQGLDMHSKGICSCHKPLNLRTK